MITAGAKSIWGPGVPVNTPLARYFKRIADKPRAPYNPIRVLPRNSRADLGPFADLTEWLRWARRNPKRRIRGVDRNSEKVLTAARQLIVDALAMRALG